MRPGTQGFAGMRLREAREARGLTAVALADFVGVTRAAVSQYERDGQSPSPPVMSRISECLNLPVQFFLRERATPDIGTVFYRSMSAATKRARQAAERRYVWLQDIAQLLADYVHFPDVLFPTFELPDDPAKIHDNLIEDLATQTRRYWGLSDGPISNVSWLLENSGAIVTRCELGAATLDAFSEWRLHDGRPFIFLNSDKASAVRSRFDAAHELGHMVLHRHLPKNVIQKTELFGLVEAQAHLFAGAFLMPSASFSSSIYSLTLDGFCSLKQTWGVSIGAMIRRAAQLGLVSEAFERRLWRNMARRKWRTCEPLDDTLPPEEPKFLRRSIEMLIGQGLFAPNELSVRLSLSCDDIEELTGLVAGYLSKAGPEIELRDAKPTAGTAGTRTFRFPSTN